MKTFLVICKALIDANDRKMVLTIGDKKVFKLSGVIKHSLDFDGSCYFIDTIDHFINDYV